MWKKLSRGGAKIESNAPHSKWLPSQNPPTNLARLFPQLGILIIGTKKEKGRRQAAFLLPKGFVFREPPRAQKENDAGLLPINPPSATRPPV
jgi:hypothetical protein